MVKMIFMTSVVGFFSYGCAVIIAWHYHIDLPLFHGALITVVMVAGPPIQLLATIYSLAKVRTWRKMALLASNPQLGVGTSLVRGERVARQPVHHKSTLEHLLGLLVWLGIASLPYWFDLPGPEAWLGLAIFVRIMMGWATPK
ncbi:hypothetical protein LP7551_04174 [Roseibium album]|nr:hypothetical protein LP7551_04174 [Roseibium album]